MPFRDFYPFYPSQHAALAGHFCFEKNRPVTFTHPLYSFFGDWVMWRDMLTGKIRF